MARVDGYRDDAAILDDDVLWRRIPPWHVVPDENLGIMRPSSAAFEDDSDGDPMSVFLAEIVKNSGRGAESILVGHTDYALSGLTAGLARRLGQGIASDPTVHEPAHAVVFGKKTKSISRALAKQSKWVVPPPDSRDIWRAVE